MSLANSIKKFMKRTGEFVSDNSTTILTYTGLALFGVSLYETGKHTQEAKDKLQELDKDIEYSCKYDHAPVPTKPQKLWMQTKAVAPIMAPTIISATVGTACIISAQRANTKKVAALTTAYELSEQYRRDYAKKVKEKFGEKAESEVQDEYYREQSEKTMPEGPKDTSIISTGKGDQLFYDSGTGRFFRASVSWLEKCRVDISQIIFANDYASANELADLIGLPSTTYGNLLGWNVDDLDGHEKLIFMRWDRCYMTEWGETYAVVEYPVHEHYKL